MRKENECKICCQEEALALPPYLLQLGIGKEDDALETKNGVSP